MVGTDQTKTEESTRRYVPTEAIDVTMHEGSTSGQLAISKVSRLKVSLIYLTAPFNPSLGA